MVTSTDVRGNGYLYIGSARYELAGAKPEIFEKTSNK